MGKVMINDLAEVLMTKHGLGRREAQRFIETFVDVVQDGVEKDKLVKIRNLGSFKLIDVEARESVNVNSGERMTIDSHTKLTFTPDNAMKELVNKPFSQFETVVLNDGVEFDEEPEALSAVTEEPEVETIPDVEVAPAAEVSSVAEAASAVEAAPVVEAEPAAPVLEEPEVAEQQIIEPQPVAEEHPIPEEQPVADDQSIPEVQPLADNQPDSDDEDEEPRRPSRWWLWLLLAILMGAGGFVAGYYVGQQKAVSQPSIPVAVDQSQQVDSLAAAQQPADTLAAAVEPDTTIVDTTKVVAPEETPRQETVKAETPRQEPVKATPSEPDYKKYEAMDVRVRTGAYRIVGTAQIAKVRPGDNTRRLAKRYLGEGMECYIEVYNGITASTPLKEGQEIKIPELKWKKKAKKN